MGVSVTQEIKYNDKLNGYVIDMSGWDYAVVQIIDPAETVIFYSSNYGGSVEGSIEDSAITVNNLVQILALDCQSGGGPNNTSASGVFKFSDFGRYIFLGSPTPCIKVISMLYKIG